MTQNGESSEKHLLSSVRSTPTVDVELKSTNAPLFTFPVILLSERDTEYLMDLLVRLDQNANSRRFHSLSPGLESANVAYSDFTDLCTMIKDVYLVDFPIEVFVNIPHIFSALYLAVNDAVRFIDQFERKGARIQVENFHDYPIIRSGLAAMDVIMVIFRYISTSLSLYKSRELGFPDSFTQIEFQSVFADVSIDTNHYTNMSSIRSPVRDIASSTIRDRLYHSLRTLSKAYSRLAAVNNGGDSSRNELNMIYNANIEEILSPLDPFTRARIENPEGVALSSSERVILVELWNTRFQYPSPPWLCEPISTSSPPSKEFTTKTSSPTFESLFSSPPTLASVCIDALECLCRSEALFSCGVLSVIQSVLCVYFAVSDFSTGIAVIRLIGGCVNGWNVESDEVKTYYPSSSPISKFSFERVLAIDNDIYSGIERSSSSSSSVHPLLLGTEAISDNTSTFPSGKDESILIHLHALLFRVCGLHLLRVGSTECVLPEEVVPSLVSTLGSGRVRAHAPLLVETVEASLRRSHPDAVAGLLGAWTLVQHTARVPIALESAQNAPTAISAFASFCTAAFELPPELVVEDDVPEWVGPLVARLASCEFIEEAVATAISSVVAAAVLQGVSLNSAALAALQRLLHFDVEGSGRVSTITLHSLAGLLECLVNDNLPLPSSARVVILGLLQRHVLSANPSNSRFSRFLAELAFTTERYFSSLSTFSVLSQGSLGSAGVSLAQSSSTTSAGTGFSGDHAHFLFSHMPSLLPDAAADVSQLGTSFQRMESALGDERLLAGFTDPTAQKKQSLAQDIALLMLQDVDSNERAQDSDIRGKEAIKDALFLAVVSSACGLLRVRFPELFSSNSNKNGNNNGSLADFKSTNFSDEGRWININPASLTHLPVIPRRPSILELVESPPFTLEHSITRLFSSSSNSRRQAAGILMEVVRSSRRSAVLGRSMGVFQQLRESLAHHWGDHSNMSMSNCETTPLEFRVRDSSEDAARAVARSLFTGPDAEFAKDPVATLARLVSLPQQSALYQKLEQVQFDHSALHHPPMRSTETEPAHTHTRPSHSLTAPPAGFQHERLPLYPLSLSPGPTYSPELISLHSPVPSASTHAPGGAKALTCSFCLTGAIDGPRVDIPESLVAAVEAALTSSSMELAHRASVAEQFAASLLSYFSNVNALHNGGSNCSVTFNTDSGSVFSAHTQLRLVRTTILAIALASSSSLVPAGSLYSHTTSVPDGNNSVAKEAAEVRRRELSLSLNRLCCASSVLTMALLASSAPARQRVRTCAPLLLALLDLLFLGPSASALTSSTTVSVVSRDSSGKNKVYSVPSTRNDASLSSTTFGLNSSTLISNTSASATRSSFLPRSTLTQSTSSVSDANSTSNGFSISARLASARSLAIVLFEQSGCSVPVHPLRVLACTEDLSSPEETPENLKGYSSKTTSLRGSVIDSRLDSSLPTPSEPHDRVFELKMSQIAVSISAVPIPASVAATHSLLLSRALTEGPFGVVPVLGISYTSYSGAESGSTSVDSEEACFGCAQSLFQSHNVSFSSSSNTKKLYEREVPVEERLANAYFRNTPLLAQVPLRLSAHVRRRLREARSHSALHMVLRYMATSGVILRDSSDTEESDWVSMDLLRQFLTTLPMTQEDYEVLSELLQLLLNASSPDIYQTKVGGRCLLTQWGGCTTPVAPLAHGDVEIPFPTESKVLLNSVALLLSPVVPWSSSSSQTDASLLLPLLELLKPTSSEQNVHREALSLFEAHGRILENAKTMHSEEIASSIEQRMREIVDSLRPNSYLRFRARMTQFDDRTSLLRRFRYNLGASLTADVQYSQESMQKGEEVVEQLPFFPGRSRALCLLLDSLSQLLDDFLSVSNGDNENKLGSTSFSAKSTKNGNAATPHSKNTSNTKNETTSTVRMTNESSYTSSTSTTIQNAVPLILDLLESVCVPAEVIGASLRLLARAAPLCSQRDAHRALTIFLRFLHSPGTTPADRLLSFSCNRHFVWCLQGLANILSTGASHPPLLIQYLAERIETIVRLVHSRSSEIRALAYTVIGLFGSSFPLQPVQPGSKSDTGLENVPTLRGTGTSGLIDKQPLPSTIEDLLTTAVRVCTGTVVSAVHGAHRVQMSADPRAMAYECPLVRTCAARCVTRWSRSSASARNLITTLLQARARAQLALVTIADYMEVEKQSRNAHNTSVSTDGNVSFAGLAAALMGLLHGLPGGLAPLLLDEPTRRAVFLLTAHSMQRLSSEFYDNNEGSSRNAGSSYALTLTAETGPISSEIAAPMPPLVSPLCVEPVFDVRLRFGHRTCVAMGHRALRMYLNGWDERTSVASHVFAVPSVTVRRSQLLEAIRDAADHVVRLVLHESASDNSRENSSQNNLKGKTENEGGNDASWTALVHPETMLFLSAACNAYGGSQEQSEISDSTRIRDSHPLQRNGWIAAATLALSGPNAYHKAILAGSLAALPPRSGLEESNTLDHISVGKYEFSDSIKLLTARAFEAFVAAADAIETPSNNMHFFSKKTSNLYPLSFIRTPGRFEECDDYGCTDGLQGVWSEPVNAMSGPAGLLCLPCTSQSDGFDFGYLLDLICARDFNGVPLLPASFVAHAHTVYFNTVLTREDNVNVPPSRSSPARSLPDKISKSNEQMNDNVYSQLLDYSSSSAVLTSLDIPYSQVLPLWALSGSAAAAATANGLSDVALAHLTRISKMLVVPAVGHSFYAISVLRVLEGEFLHTLRQLRSSDSDLYTLGDKQSNIHNTLARVAPASARDAVAVRGERNNRVYLEEKLRALASNSCASILTSALKCPDTFPYIRRIVELAASHEALAELLSTHPRNPRPTTLKHSAYALSSLSSANSEENKKSESFVEALLRLLGLSASERRPSSALGPKTSGNHARTQFERLELAALLKPLLSVSTLCRQIFIARGALAHCVSNATQSLQRLQTQPQKTELLQTKGVDICLILGLVASVAVAGDSHAVTAVARAPGLLELLQDALAPWIFTAASQAVQKGPIQRKNQLDQKSQSYADIVVRAENQLTHGNNALTIVVFALSTLEEIARATQFSNLWTSRPLLLEAVARACENPRASVYLPAAHASTCAAVGAHRVRSSLADAGVLDALTTARGSARALLSAIQGDAHFLKFRANDPASECFWEFQGFQGSLADAVGSLEQLIK